MPEERLIVGGTFDSSGIVAGVNDGAAALQEFERRIQQVAASLPGINVEEFLAGARQAAREEIAELQRLQVEATRTSAALNRVGAESPTGGLRIIRDKVADLKLLAGQLQQVQAQQDIVGAGARRMADGFAVAGAAARRSSDGAAAWQQGLANLRGQTKTATDGHAGHTQALRQTASALANMAQQAVGASGPLGNLAQVALSFSAGNLAVIGVAAATIALVGVYRFLTTASRELTAANEKRLTSLREEAANAVPAAVKAAQDLTAAYEAQAQAKRTLGEKVGGFIAGVANVLDPAALRTQVQAETERRATEKAIEAAQDIVLAKRKLLAVNEELLSSNLKSITAAIELGTASTSTFTLAAAHAARLTVEIDSGTLSLDQQAAKVRELQSLQTALDIVPRANREAAKQALADDLAAEQQVIQARASLTQQAFAEDLIIRQEYFARRRQQAEQAAAADIANLRSQVAAARQSPANTDAERIAQAALISHLQAQIRLRQELIAVQRAQLDSEKRLSDQELLSRAGLGPGQVGAPAFLSTGITLKPKFDLSQIRADLERIKTETEDAFGLARQQKKLEDFGVALGRVGQAAHVFAQVGSDLGFLDNRLASAIDNAGRLSDAFENIVLNGASFTSILGAVSAGASLLGGLIGGGPTKQELLIQELNQRLAELKASLDRSLVGAGGLATAGRDIDIIDTLPRTIGPKGIDLGIDEAALRAQLAAAGSTIEEWAARIEAVTGFDVLDDAGHVIEASANAAAEALGLLSKQALEFGQSVSEQAALIANRDRIFGTGTAQDRNRSVVLGGLVLDPAVEARIAALDLETEAGRRAYLTFLQQMQLAAEAGTLTAEQLGAFRDVAEFSDKAAEGADALAAAAEDAASRIAEAAAEEVRARQAATEALQNSVSDAVTRSQFQGGDSARQFADLAGFLKGTGFDQSPALRAVLEQANTASAEGREALKQALFDLLVKAQFETLTPDQLGALSPDALEELIRQLGGLIDGISADADRAADERARAAEDAERSAEQVRRDQEAAARAARQAFEEARRQAVDARREQEWLGELRERLAGSDQSAAAKFARDVARLQDAMPQVGDILEGLDLDDPKSREVLRKRLAALFDQFTGGDFEKLNFTRDEFLAFLEKGADFLDEFGNSVNDATKSMLNFPTGINLAALEFQAQAAGAKDVARILPVALPSRRGTDGAALPQIIDDRLERAVVALAERTGGDTITYNVTVHLPRGSTAEQARAFVEALKRQSVVRTGSPDKWSQG